MIIGFSDPQWGQFDPYEAIKRFEDEHVTNVFAEGDKASPARSEVVELMGKALRMSLDQRFVLNLPEQMSDMINELLRTGLYGGTAEETIERLCAERLAQLIEDNSPLLGSEEPAQLKLG